MYYLISIIWLIYATINRYFQTEELIDYHLIGAMTANSCEISIVLQPQYQYEDNIAILFHLLEVHQENQLKFDRKFVLQKSKDKLAIKVTLSNLLPNQRYLFKYKASIYEQRSQEDAKSQFNSKVFEKQFKTFSKEVQNVTFVAISNSNLMSDSQVYDYIQQKNVDFVMNLGNIHYSARNRSQENDFLFGFHEVMKTQNQKNFYEKYPLIYVFNENDFGSAGVDANRQSNQYANKAYRHIIPHYLLRERNGIYQSFIVNQVLFIVCDLRSFKNQEKIQNFGERQLNWIKYLLNNSISDNNIKGAILVLPYSWNSRFDWFKENLFEKIDLSQTIINLGFNSNKTNKFLVAIQGENSQITYDTGFKNQYGKFPVFSCSGIDQLPKCHTGPYHEEIYLNRGQYCQFNLYQKQNQMCLQFQGIVVNQTVMEFDTCNNTIKEEFELFYNEIEQMLNDDEVSADEKKQLELQQEYLFYNNMCSPTPEVKINLSMVLFATIYIVLLLYTIFRNVFKRTFE